MKRSAMPGAAPETESILESISDGVFTVDEAWRIRSFNRAAETITGIPRERALGRRCSEVLRSTLCETDCALRRTLASGRPIVNRPCWIEDASGRRVPVSISTAVLRDAAGRVVGGAETFRDLSEVEELRRELAGRHRVGDLVSRSPLMHRLFDVLQAVAASTSTVLVQGETGTGKELLARAVHDLGPRREGPFVAVNCSALPDTLLESELFGHRAGAFTGAGRDRPGRFAAARGGTIFLDEIGDVSPAMQVRLLRVLQDGQFEPLGSDRSEVSDARVIAATNRDLPTLVARGDFREDLFYRLDVVRLHLPPLRERTEDVPLLVEHFVARFNRLQGRAVPGIDAEALAALMAHRWPGNVRELENVVERAFVLCGDGPVGLAHLPEELAFRVGPAAAGCSIRASWRALEARSIEEALARHGGNRLAAARELGIHKSTLFRKMRTLGVTPPRQDGRSR